MKRTAAVIISAVATGLAVSYILPPAFEFVSLVPYLFVLFSYTGEKKWLRRGMQLGFLYFYVYYLTVWHWFLQMYPLEFTGISKPSALAVVTVAWLGLPLWQASAALLQVPLFLFMSRSPWLSHDGKPRASMPVAYAAVLALFEWIQSLTWAGVPWGRLAIGQAYVPAAIGTASLLGAYFVSFIIAAVNGYVALAVMALKDKERRRSAALVLIAAVIAAADLLYGTVRVRIYINERNASDCETVTVAVLQGNVSSRDKWGDGKYNALLSIYTELTEAAVADGADVVIFPETAIPASVNGRNNMRRDLETLAEESGAMLLATGYWRESEDVEYNSIFTIDPETGLDEENVYYKQHLVPFGEFVPFESVFRVLVPPLASLGLFDGQIAAGDSGRLLETPFGEVGGMVCFDSIYEHVALDGVRAGAELLTVSTNDSWFDGSAAVWQHTAQAVLRAVECDRYVCRAGNTGFSCVITPEGNIVSSIEPETRGYAIYSVSMRDTRTLYSYVGNVFVYTAGIFAVVCVICIIIYDCKTKCGKRKADVENGLCDRDRHRDVGDEDSAV